MPSVAVQFASDEPNPSLYFPFTKEIRWPKFSVLFQYVSLLRPPVTDSSVPGAEVIDKQEWKQVSWTMDTLARLWPRASFDSSLLFGCLYSWRISCSDCPVRFRFQSPMTILGKNIPLNRFSLVYLIKVEQGGIYRQPTPGQTTPAPIPNLEIIPCDEKKRTPCHEESGESWILYLIFPLPSRNVLHRFPRSNFLICLFWINLLNRKVESHFPPLLTAMS